MKLTLDFALETKLEIANFDNAIVYLNSHLYFQEIQNKIKLSHNYLGFSQHSYNDSQNLTSNHFSVSDILKFRNYAQNKYHKDEGCLKLVENKLVSDTRKNLEETAKIKLKQKLLKDQ